MAIRVWLGRWLLIISVVTETCIEVHVLHSNARGGENTHNMGHCRP